MCLAACGCAADSGVDPVLGEAQYKLRCAGCHDRAGERIPPKNALNGLPAFAVAD
jgi:hypothetical protein